MKKVLLSGLALAVLAVTTGHEAVPQATTEPIGLDDVLERLQVIEDRQAILDLQFRYSSYNDNGFKADRIADMFVEEGVWTGGVFGTYVGVEAIKGFFQSAPSFAKYSVHYTTNPMIEVKGDVASAKYRLLLVASVVNPDGVTEPIIYTADYDNALARVDGQWKFTKIDVHFDFGVIIGESWVGAENPRWQTNGAE